MKPPRKPARKPHAKRPAAKTAPVPPRHVGQPAYFPSESDKTAVLVMTAAGITQADIAPCLGISPKTLRANFRVELRIGVAKINGLCAQGIVKAIQKGEAWACCFWAKTRMGWREKSALDEVSEITVKRLVGVAIEDV
jgi:hypothetical protein